MCGALNRFRSTRAQCAQSRQSRSGLIGQFRFVHIVIWTVVAAVADVGVVVVGSGSGDGDARMMAVLGHFRVENSAIFKSMMGPLSSRLVCLCVCPSACVGGKQVASLSGR